MCDVPYEMIINMDDPSAGAYSVWTSIYGEDNQDSAFSSAVVLENGHILMVGHSQFDNNGVANIVFVEYDMRGRVVEQMKIVAGDVIDVRRILRFDKGFVVLANTQKGGKLYILDDKRSVISKRDFAFGVRDITMGHDGKSLYMVGFVQSPPTAHSVVVRTDMRGGIIFERHYKTGVDNLLFSIAKAQEDSFILSGQSGAGARAQHGWAMRIDKDGDLLWQQQYGRGLGARFQGAAMIDENRVVMVGQVIPFDTKLSGAWVVMADAGNGNILWQRYLRGSTYLAAQDVMVFDEYISVFLKAKNAEDQGFGYLTHLSHFGKKLGSSQIFSGTSLTVNDAEFMIGDMYVMSGSSLEKTGNELGIYKAGWISVMPKISDKVVAKIDCAEKAVDQGNDDSDVPMRSIEAIFE